MKKTFLVLLLAAGITIFGEYTKATAQMTIVNFAMWNTPNSGQGVIGGPDDIWNQINVNSGNVTSTGDYTGITFTDTSPLSFQGPADAFVPLLTHYLLTGSTTVETLNNVPAGTYDLYLYGQNGTYNSRGAVFTLDGVSESAINNHGNGASYVEGANYVEFANITLESPGSITFTYSGGPGIGGEGNFNGLQLEAIPEPSTFVLGSIGTIGMLLALQGKKRARSERQK